MGSLNLSHQGTYTVSNIWNFHYQYINHTEEKHPMLLSKGVILYQKLTLGSGHNSMQSHYELVNTRTKNKYMTVRLWKKRWKYI